MVDSPSSFAASESRAGSMAGQSVTPRAERGRAFSHHRDGDVAILITEALESIAVHHRARNGTAVSLSVDFREKHGRR